MKATNLVVVHLESVSREATRLFPELFPTLSRLEMQSLALDHFVTSAPASINAFCDFMYGNSSELDHIEDFDGAGNAPAGYQRHLMDILREHGYTVRGAGFPTIWRDDINHWQLFGEGHFDWFEGAYAFEQSVSETISRDAPFAFYLWDLRSHLSYSDESKPAELPGFDRVRRGYGCTDETLASVLRMLDDAGKLDETLVVAFGDHGDQLWTHGSYFGFCHAFEPYTQLIQTPALLRFPGGKAARHRGVVSMVDLKTSILCALGLDVEETTRSDSGVAIQTLEQARSHAFCQSLFVGQRPNKALPKCFSVTNADYHLITGPDGLELYAHRFDPTNHNNLLSFFELNDAGGLRFEPGEITHGHFRNTLNPPQVAEIRDNFNTLRAALAAHLRYKYSDPAQRRHPFDATGLTRVRPRECPWNRRYDCASDQASEELSAFLSGVNAYAAF